MVSVTGTSWLAWPRPNPQASLRLFCIPYAGGGTQVYHTWPDYLPESIEVCSIKLPGRGARMRETPFANTTPLIHALAPNLLPYLDKPYALFGHSMGALVSFELASHLRRQSNSEPIHLFASGCRAPQIPEPHPIYNLPEIEFLEELRSLGGVSQDVMENSELMQLMLPTIRADCTLSDTYTYKSQPPLSCSISVFGGLQDPLVSREHLEAWRCQTSASFTLMMFPGDHFFLHTSKLLLLEQLSSELRQIVKMTTSRRPQ